MKAFLLDVKNRVYKPIEIDDSNHLAEFYSFIGCFRIDIANRNIGGKRFDIIIDDEGTEVANPILSAIDSELNPALFGNLIFCNYDPKTGEEIGLNDLDIAHLKKHIRKVYRREIDGTETETGIVMTRVDY